MLHDDRRTLDYLAAIRAAVGTGDVVVDIGTGNGILALAAARAGARQVYAIEATDIADVAEEVFAVNGVGDRVTVVRGWSALVDLPERANVMVTETIGSEPLEEDILGTVLDARRRLLTPDAVMIPNRLTLLARPLLLPDEAARQRSIGPAALRRWKRLYDVDFQPLLDAAAGQPIQDPVEAETVSQWPPVGPVATLATIDFATLLAGYDLGNNTANRIKTMDLTALNLAAVGRVDRLNHRRIGLVAVYEGRYTIAIEQRPPRHVAD